MNVSEEDCNCRLVFPLYFLFEQLPTSPVCSINMWLCPILSFAWKISAFLFVSVCLSFQSSCHGGMQDTKSIEKWDSDGGGGSHIPPPPPSCEGREQMRKEGGGMGGKEGEGKHTQTEPCDISALWEEVIQCLCRRKEDKKKRREWGNKCKTAGLKEMHKSCSSSCLHRTKTTVSEWELVSSATRNRQQSSFHLSPPVSVSPSLPLPAWTELYDLWAGFSGAVASDLELCVLGICYWSGFERAVVADWTQCATWRLLCSLPRPAASISVRGYGPDWKTAHHTDAQFRLHGRVILQTPAWEPNRWNGKKNWKCLLLFTLHVQTAIFSGGTWAQQLCQA